MNQTLMSSNASPDGRGTRWRVYAGIGVAAILALVAGAWLLGRGHAAAAAPGKDGVVPPLITVIIPSRGEWHVYTPRWHGYPPIWQLIRWFMTPVSER